MMFDLQQATPPPRPIPPSIVVQRAADNAPAYLMGFTAFGLDQDLARLQAMANTLKQPAARITTLDGQQQLILTFTPTTPRDVGLKLYHDALAGKYGNLRVVAMIVALRDAADGIDLDKEVQMTSPSAIKE